MRLESNPQTITIDQDEEDATVQFAISVIACDCDDQMQKYSFENNILKEQLKNIRHEHKEEILKIKENNQQLINEYDSRFEKCTEKVNTLKLTVKEYENGTKYPRKTMHSDQIIEVNIDSKDRPDYSELKLLFNSAQEKITEISEQLDTLKGENSQLRGDIKTLIDFKNELESLAEDQDKQIQNLNDTCERFTEQLKNKDETIQFLDTESKAKSNEICELNKDIKHLMEERTAMIK